MVALARVVSFCFLLAVPSASARRVEVGAHGREGSIVADAKPDLSMLETCSETSVIEPGKDVAYFKQQREALGIDQCTKQDVCLLMRQLDAAFYEKARLGDVGRQVLPQHAWLEQGRCADGGRGVRMLPVRKLSLCEKQANMSVTVVDEADKDKYPEGCVIRTVAPADGSPATKKVFFNNHTSGVKAGTEYKETGTKPWSSRKTIRLSQLCFLDVTLDPAAAYYYSPYKLKQSMVERTAFSTTCSFGMMAHLYNVGKTESPCAQLLAWRPDWEYTSAEEALSAAEAAGPAGQSIRDDVERLRKKFVLMDVLTNHWCPETWTFALGTDPAHESTATACLAPRLPPWVKDFHDPDDEVEAAKAEVILEGKEKKGELIPQREDKLTLTDATCAAITDFVDESLETVLETKPELPPDFFEKALVPEEE